MKKKRNIQCFWQKNFYILKEHKRENIRVHILYISFFIIPPEFPLFSENIPFTTFREGGMVPMCGRMVLFTHNREAGRISIFHFKSFAEKVKKYSNGKGRMRKLSNKIQYKRYLTVEDMNLNKCAKHFRVLLILSLLFMLTS